MKLSLFACLLSIAAAVPMSAQSTQPKYFLQVVNMAVLATEGVPVPTGTPDMIDVLVEPVPHVDRYCVTVTYIIDGSGRSVSGCSVVARTGWTMVPMSVASVAGASIQSVSIEGLMIVATRVDAHPVDGSPR